jgi:hypothetical protein
MNGRYNITYYPNKTFSPFNIDSYKKFMLSKDAAIHTNSVPVNIDVEKIDTVPQVEEKFEKEELFQPKQNDTLFWSLYVLYHGMGEYMNIGHNYGVKELEEKQRLATFVRENKFKIKGTNHKVTNVLIQEILSELLTSQKETSLHVLGAFTVFYNINILLVDANQRCMLEYLDNKEMDNNTKTYILYKDKYGKYRAQLEWISSSRIQEMRQQYIVLENYLRPMKAAAAYKVEELAELARRLSVYDENKKYKKSELYDVVHELCKWT